MADIKINVTEQNQVIINSLQQVIMVAGQTGKSLNDAGASAGGFFATLSEGFTVVKGIVGAVMEIGDAIKTLTAPGYEFVKNMEQNKVSMAGMIQSMTTMNGQAVPFANAMAISADMMEKLNRDALKTSVTTEELAGVFTSIMKPGMDAGMNLEQIRKVSVAGANAVKVLSPNNGQMRQQMESEMSGLIQGNIQPSSSKLAQTLGITNEDIEAAKNSSEGLFQFLMDKFQLMNDATAKLPDTLSGKEEQLKKVWVQASAAFTEEFEQPIKDGLTAVTNLIGEVDANTGELHLNPELLSAVKLVHQEFKDWFNIIQQINTNALISDSTMLSGLGEIYYIAKNIVTSMVDMETALERLLGIDVLKSFFGQGFKDLMHDLREASDIIAEAWRILAGRQKTTGPDGSSLSNPNVAGDGIRTIPTSKDDRALYEGQTAIKNKYIPKQTIDTNLQAWELLKSRYNEKVAYIKAQAESDEAKIKQTMENEDTKQQADKNLGLPGNPFHEQNDSLLKQELLKIQLNAKLQQREELVNLIAIGESQQASTEINPWKEKLAGLNTDINGILDNVGTGVKEVSEIGTIMKMFPGLMGGLSSTSGSNAIPAMESSPLPVESGIFDYDGVKDEVKKAGNVLGHMIEKEFGILPTITSGKRSEEYNKSVDGAANSFHLTGDALDMYIGTVDEATASRIKEQAKTLFNEVLYHDAGSGLHLHVADLNSDAINQMANNKPNTDIPAYMSIDQLREALKSVNVSTPAAAKLLNDVNGLINDAQKLDKELLSLSGDNIGAQRKQLEQQKDALVDKFNKWGRPDYARKAEKVFEANMAKADLTQITNDWRISKENLTRDINEINSKFLNGKEIKVDDKTSNRFDALKDTFKKYQDNQQILISNADMKAQTTGAPEDKQKVAQMKDQAQKDAQEFWFKIMDDERARMEAEIQALQDDPTLDVQKRYDKTIEIRKKYAPTIISAAGEAEKSAKDNGDFKSAASANQLGNSFKMVNNQMSWMDNQIAGSLQSNLESFFTTGIQGAKSMGDAFRGLATGILSSLNQIFAKQMTSQIMKAIYPNYNPEKNAQGGHIQGPGTGTSDSILSWLSNGEFVIKASSVKKYGTNFLHSLNNGFIPNHLMPHFATGGLVGASVEGATAIASSMQSGDVTVPLKVVNVTDPNEVGRYLKTRSGERIMVNFMKNNAGTMRQILNVKG